MISVTAALGLGKLIGFGLVWLHDKICPYAHEPVATPALTGVSALFFDKAYIANLKGV